MSKGSIVVLALIVALGLATPALLADKGGKGKGHGHEKAEFDKHDRDRDDHDRGDRDRDDRDRGWERRENHEYRIYGINDGRPPGWNYGRKTGWRDCGLPPGQAKKYGCRVYMYEGRPHYYYQDERGQIYVRRPILEV